MIPRLSFSLALLWCIVPMCSHCGTTRDVELFPMPKEIFKKFEDANRPSQPSSRKRSKLSGGPRLCPDCSMKFIQVNLGEVLGLFNRNTSVAREWDDLIRSEEGIRHGNQQRSVSNDKFFIYLLNFLKCGFEGEKAVQVASSNTPSASSASSFYTPARDVRGRGGTITPFDSGGPQRSESFTSSSTRKATSCTNYAEYTADDDDDQCDDDDDPCDEDDKNNDGVAANDRAQLSPTERADLLTYSFKEGKVDIFDENGKKLDHIPIYFPQDLNISIESQMRLLYLIRNFATMVYYLFIVDTSFHWYYAIFTSISHVLFNYGLPVIGFHKNDFWKSCDEHFCVLLHWMVLSQGFSKSMMKNLIGYFTTGSKKGNDFKKHYTCCGIPSYETILSYIPTATGSRFDFSGQHYDMPLDDFVRKLRKYQPFGRIFISIFYDGVKATNTNFKTMPIEEYIDVDGNKCRYVWVGGRAILVRKPQTEAEKRKVYSKTEIKVDCDKMIMGPVMTNAELDKLLENRGYIDTVFENYLTMA